MMTIDYSSWRVSTSTVTSIQRSGTRGKWRWLSCTGTPDVELIRTPSKMGKQEVPRERIGEKLIFRFLFRYQCRWQPELANHCEDVSCSCASKKEQCISTDLAKVGQPTHQPYDDGKKRVCRDIRSPIVLCRKSC